MGRLVEKSLLPKNRFSITQYSTKEGLPQIHVHQITSKKSGALIISTSGGVVEFNGYSFKPLLWGAQTQGLIFRRLYWSEKFELLSGTDFSGQYHVITPELKLINPAAANKEFICNAMVNNDTVCLISESGIIYCGLLPKLKMKVLSTKGVKYAKCICHAYPYVYMGSLNGLFRLDQRTNTIKKIADGIFVRINKNPYDGSIYAVELTKLYKISGHQANLLFSTFTSKEDDVCLDVTFTNKNGIVLATRKGIYVFNHNEVKHITAHNGLLSDHIESVYFDSRDKCVYAGTQEKGFLKLQSKEINSYSADEGFDISSLSSIIRTSDGKVLTAETCCNIYEFLNDRAVTYSKLKNGYASLAEIDGFICAGTWGNGIMLIKKGRMVANINIPNLPNDCPRSVFKDSHGFVWVGTNNGIARGKSLFTLSPFLKDTIKGNIICFYELRNGSVCVGGTGGVFIIKNGKIITRISEVQGKEVRCFYEDTPGRLWFGTYENGLFCYNNNRLTNINSMKNCMLNRDIFCLAKDSLNYFNITSNNGLWRVAEKDLFDFYEGKLQYLVPLQYGEETGIINPEFNGGFQNNYLKMGGNFYFPTIDGLVKFAPKKPTFHKCIPAIDHLYLNDTIAPPDLKILSRETNSIRFDFSCVNLNNKYNIYFQHKFIGQKSYDWSMPQKSKTAYLKLLPPGTYTFVVRAIDGFNDRHPNEVSLTFKIKPYFYETRWFILASALFLALLGAIVIRWRIWLYKKRTTLKEEYSRKLAELELRAIQAQLNPHFLFNCMNTIKYFILEKNFTRANESLNMLSTMLRNSLETSDLMFIPLCDKIKFLRNYIELEKMRLGDLLEYKIICDENLSPETLIPHFIIQPYVENAIKHGISHLEVGKGRLEIKFSYNEPNLVCTITDNGIGRNASSDINSKNRLNHQSKGTKLTQEKASFLKVYNNYDCEIRVDDLYDKNHKPTGTKVTITTPLNNDSRHN